MSTRNNRPMLNAYPDSMGGSLNKIVSLLTSETLKGAFSSFYILPSLYHSDLDRGFSVIDYDLEEKLAKREDLDALKEQNIDIKLDFILNHASVQSPQFQDLLQKGEYSEYKDFFIDWNKFWNGHGTMTEEGYIQPDKELIKHMFFRKPGLPILMVCFPDGKKVPYWNTFYQEILDENQYMGQMDLNLKSPLVWEFYQKTLEKISQYGAAIVRLDAFAYAPKEVGKRNFLNEPDTWEVLDRIKAMADKEGMELLPEIHASYAEGVYKKIAEKGYLTYDFFLPGLILDAIENQRVVYLGKWAQELYSENIRTVNMLGCHDGIPLLDLEGLLKKEDIESLIHTLVKRGGYVKNLHGQKNVYYQVNTTYFSALGEDENKLLLARAIQMFMPGKPQIWYLDLFAGVNDYEAVKRAGAGGHKEINRTNLSVDEVKNALEKTVVKKQIALIRFRNTCRAFHPDAVIKTKAEGHMLTISWEYHKTQAVLTADLQTCKFDIQVME